MRDDDIVFSAAKLFFAYGLGNAMAFPLHRRPTGGADERAAHSRLGDGNAREAPAHVFCGSPLFCRDARRRRDRHIEGSLRLRASISAGEAPPSTFAGASASAPTSLDGIGSTEMLHIFIPNRHGDVKHGSPGKPFRA